MALCTFIMNGGLSCHQNTSIIKERGACPSFPGMLFKIAIVLLHCCFFSCFNPAIYIVLIMIFIVFPSVEKELSLSFFVLYIYRHPLSKKKKNSTKSSNFFFQNSIVCRVFLKFQHAPLLFCSLFSVVFIYLFLLPKRQRERERETSSSPFFLILCAYNLSASPTKRTRTEDEPAKEQQQTHITITSGTRFIHTLSLLTFDLKEERVHKKNDLSRFFGHAAARERYGNQALTHVFFWGGRSCRCPCSEIAITRTRERRTRGTVWAP